MDDLDENGIDSLIKDIRTAPKTRKVKWTCPLCSGSSLSKQKVLQTESYDMNVDVSLNLGEMFVTVCKGDNILEETKFPIKYCPICGKKVRKFPK